MSTSPADPLCFRPGICHGPRCRDYGGAALLEKLQAQGIEAEAIDCQSLCPHSPVVRLPQRCLPRASLDDVVEALEAPRATP